MLCISTMITLCGEVKALGVFCMVYVLNVLPLNTPLACSLSAVDLDWTDYLWRKMGDDLGDEWWTHEGNPGIFYIISSIYFSVCETC